MHIPHLSVGGMSHLSRIHHPDFFLQPASVCLNIVCTWYVCSSVDVYISHVMLWSWLFYPEDPDTGPDLQQAMLQGSVVDEAVKLLQLQQDHISGE